MNKYEQSPWLIIVKGVQKRFYFPTKHVLNQQKGDKHEKQIRNNVYGNHRNRLNSASAGVYATPLMSTTTVSPNAMASKISTYVLVDGAINASGANAAVGTIQAQSRTTVGPALTILGFSSTAIWSTNTSRPLATAIKRENFTYTFYTARLVQGNYSALDFNGAAFFMNGTWNVWNITETFTIITDASGTVLNVNSDQNAARLAVNAYGEFTANPVGENFTLSITGVDPVTGTVTFMRETSRLFNP